MIKIVSMSILSQTGTSQRKTLRSDASFRLTVAIVAAVVVAAVVVFIVVVVVAAVVIVVVVVQRPVFE